MTTGPFLAPKLRMFLKKTVGMRLKSHSIIRIDPNALRIVYAVSDVLQYGTRVATKNRLPKILYCSEGPTEAFLDATGAVARLQLPSPHRLGCETRMNRCPRPGNASSPSGSAQLLQASAPTLLASTQALSPKSFDHQVTLGWLSLFSMILRTNGPSACQ
jgi:hypothetical protein